MKVSQNLSKSHVTMTFLSLILAGCASAALPPTDGLMCELMAHPEKTTAMADPTPEFTLGRQLHRRGGCADGLPDPRRLQPNQRLAQDRGRPLG